jgi:hypothetical protein
MASVSGERDLGTHDGRLMARIQGAVARKESDDKSRRIKRKAQELAVAGKVAGGGSRPFGYEADKRTVRESEAVVIRECARRLLAGEMSQAGFDGDLDPRMSSWGEEILHGRVEIEEVSGGVAGAGRAAGVRVGPSDRACRG